MSLQRSQCIITNPCRPRLLAALEQKMNCKATMMLAVEEDDLANRPSQHFVVIAKAEEATLRLTLPLDPRAMFGDRAEEIVNYTPRDYVGGVRALGTGAPVCDHCSEVLAEIKMSCQYCRHAIYCGARCKAAHWEAGHKRVCTRDAPAPIV